MHSNHLGIREPLASTRYLTIPHDGIILRAISFFNHTATTEIYTLSLHDALPISPPRDDCLGIVQSSRLCSRGDRRSEEHTSEPQSRQYLVCRFLLEKKIGYNIPHKSEPRMSGFDVKTILVPV